MAMLTKAVACTLAISLLSGCSATFGSAGPAGPPGPIGPRGAQFARALFADQDMTVTPDTDVVVARAALAVTLPAAGGAGRLITVRAAGGTVTVRPAANERVERTDRFVLEDGEMATFLADGAAGWFVISSSDL